MSRPKVYSACLRVVAAAPVEPGKAPVSSHELTCAYLSACLPAQTLAQLGATPAPIQVAMVSFPSGLDVPVLGPIENAGPVRARVGGPVNNNDSSIASAVLDRLLHHAETVIIEGPSYRMKDQIES